MSERLREVSVELDVPFRHVDLLGVVWHGHYYKYMEEARTPLLRACGVESDELIGSRGLSGPNVAQDLLDALFPEGLAVDLRYRAELTVAGTASGRLHRNHLVPTPIGEELLAKEVVPRRW